MDRDLRKRHSSLKTEDVNDDEECVSSERKLYTQYTILESNDVNKTSTDVDNIDLTDRNGSLVTSYSCDGDLDECSEKLIEGHKKKIGEIEAALKSPVDVISLRSLARSEGGLINDAIRRRVWPHLLEIVDEKSSFSASEEEMKTYKDLHQIILDVNRSLKRFPPGISDSERMILQDQLTKLMLNVIIKHPFLCYYQGYHDVAVTLLLVVGDYSKVSRSSDEDEDRIMVEKKSSSVLNGAPESDSSMLEFSDSETIGEEPFQFDGESKHADDGVENVILSPRGKQTTSDSESKTSEFFESKDDLSLDEFAYALINREEVSSSEQDLVVGMQSDVRGEEEDLENIPEVAEWISWSDREEEITKEKTDGHGIRMWCSGVALKMLEHLSLHQFRECMEPTMDSTSRLLHHIFPIISREDHVLCAFLDKCGVGTLFSLPWIVTWYSHSLSNHKVVVRLYDYFLASHECAPLYLAASILLFRRKEILETECDMGVIHGLLSQIPDDLPFELLLSRASALYDAYPPQSLQEDVEERFSRELQARGERSSKLNASKMNKAPAESPLIPWPILAVLRPPYINRLVPWFWMTHGRMRWIGDWARMIPVRHINGRFVLAAIPFAMYYAYSHLAANTGS